MRNRLLICYVIAASALMTSILLLQYFKYNIFGTNLLLGWDSPGYVWLAKDVIAEGPSQIIGTRKYPYLYTQLSALLGYLSGNPVIVERIFPLFFGALLIFASAKLTHKITNNIHIAGLAGFLTAVSLNTLRLLADLNRNLMALSLSFLSLVLISDFASKNAMTWKSLLNKKYLSTILIVFVIAGTQFETFLVLALSLIISGILTRNWKKLVAFTLPPTIPTVIFLSLFPQLSLRYLEQMRFFTNELTLNEILLWSGGSWILFSFLIAGTAYVSYKALRQRDMLASMIFSWVIVITLLVILTMQRVIPFSADYTLRSLMILPIPVLSASAVFGSANMLKDIFLEVGLSTQKRKHTLKVSVRQIAMIGTALVLVTSSAIITSQHYDKFLTPYIPHSSYEKISFAGEFLSKNGLSKPIVVFYGEHASWFSRLYRSYLGVEIGNHFSYNGDVRVLLSSTAVWSENDKDTLTSSRLILIITPYLYDKEIPYYITKFHIGQGVYVIPPNSTISSRVDYGPTVTVAGDSGIREVRSEYLYADPRDPSLIVLRVTTRNCTSYTLENYPSDWTFLRLTQGGSLSFPEKDPRRPDGNSAIEGNDPAESTRDWNMPQTGTIRITNSSKKEGYAGLEVEGRTDSWGNLGARYNPAGTWNLSGQSLLAVWAKASEKTAFSIGLHDSAGNVRTFWDIQPDGSSATFQWKRFTVNLYNYTSQSQCFDLARVDSIDFYVYSSPGKRLALSIDDIVVDDIGRIDATVYKSRVISNEYIVAYFAVRKEQFSSS